MDNAFLLILFSSFDAFFRKENIYPTEENCMIPQYRIMSKANPIAEFQDPDWHNYKHCYKHKESPRS